ncbi:hypothetical protein FNV43_RR27112 [Rhamnella rubrinervis]|uniref:ADP-ribosyl cyclase/cyclic ADP-ribose hydrolase n=1 Tax=Rhamnella rubrinervis TaxID=2594499 RepID=A0A8K0GKA8_9ROSA|nr:hypothetical protein FNV43_RR27112 [Rhamnella rubrinervis]
MTTETPSSKSSTPTWKRWVFLSFRGEDTRTGFTDHLYHALSQKAIDTFRDNEGLKRGEEIPPALWKGIEESRYAIVVLSEKYASSTWCLRELTKIAECKRVLGQTVIPIFYHVDKTDLIKPFAEHERNGKDNMEEVNKWREALTEVANLPGWDLKDGYL